MYNVNLRYYSKLSVANSVKLHNRCTHPHNQISNNKNSSGYETQGPRPQKPPRNEIHDGQRQSWRRADIWGLRSRSLDPLAIGSGHLIV